MIKRVRLPTGGIRKRGPAKPLKIGVLMQTTGIRILDNNDGFVSVKLQDILEEIDHGELFHWSILYFYGMGHLKDGKSIQDFEEEAIESEKGILMKWEELNSFANTIDQLFGIFIIGCKDLQRIARYKNEKEKRYEICDIVIEMIDSAFWEVFSKDEDLINRLAAKFKDVELLIEYPRFQKENA